MPKCSFCGKDYDELFQGLTYVHTDGNIKHFCCSKCKKNSFMNRRKVVWVSKSVEGKEGTIQIEKRKKSKKKSSSKITSKKRKGK